MNNNNRDRVLHLAEVLYNNTFGRAQVNATEGGEGIEQDALIITTHEKPSRDNQQPELHIGQQVRMSIHHVHRVENYRYQGEIRRQWLEEEALCEGNTAPLGGGIFRTNSGFWVNPIFHPEVDLSAYPHVNAMAKCNYCDFEERIFMRSDGTISRTFTP